MKFFLAVAALAFTCAGSADDSIWTTDLWRPSEGQYAESIIPSGDGGAYLLYGSDFFDKGTLTTTYSHYVVKIDAEGAFDWHKRIVRGTLESTAQISCDPSGNLYVASTAQDDEFGSQPTGNLIKYAPDGTVLWSKEMSDRSSTGCMALDNGDVLNVGSIENDSNQISYITRYDAQGNLLWEKTTPGVGVESIMLTQEKNVALLSHAGIGFDSRIHVYDGAGNSLHECAFQNAVSGTASSGSAPSVSIGWTNPCIAYFIAMTSMAMPSGN